MPPCCIKIWCKCSFLCCRRCSLLSLEECQGHYSILWFVNRLLSLSQGSLGAKTPCTPCTCTHWAAVELHTYAAMLLIFLVFTRVPAHCSLQPCTKARPPRSVAMKIRNTRQVAHKQRSWDKTFTPSTQQSASSKTIK